MYGSSLDAKHLQACVLIAANVVACCPWLIFGRAAGHMTWSLSIPSYGRSSNPWYTWTHPLLTLMSGSPVTCGSPSCHCVHWSLVRKFQTVIGRFSVTPGRLGSGLWALSCGLLGACI